MKSDAQAAEKQVLALKSRMAKHNNGSGSTKQLSTTRSEKDSSTSSVTPHHTAQNNLGFINSFSAKDDVSVISKESKKRKFVAVTELPKRQSTVVRYSSRVIRGTRDTADLPVCLVTLNAMHT